MRKFIADFAGVPNGEVYPKQYRPGDGCPAELLDAAVEAGALEPEADEPAKAEAKKAAETKDMKKAPENK